MPKQPEPADDSSAFQACEIEVTPAMIEAGADRLHQLLSDLVPNRWPRSADVVAEVYRAMSALSPKA